MNDNRVESRDVPWPEYEALGFKVSVVPHDKSPEIPIYRMDCTVCGWWATIDGGWTTLPWVVETHQKEGHGMPEYLICDAKELKGPCRIYGAHVFDLRHSALLIRDNDPSKAICHFDWKSDPTTGPIVVPEGHCVNVIDADPAGLTPPPIKATRLFYVEGLRNDEYLKEAVL